MQAGEDTGVQPLEEFMKHITAASVTWDVCICIQLLFNFTGEGFP